MKNSVVLPLAFLASTFTLVFADFDDLSTAQILSLIRDIDNFKDESADLSLQRREQELLRFGMPPAGDLPSSGPRTTASGSLKAPSPSSSPKNGVLPAYCDPPNPCPLGYTEKDGCVEDFENTSEFSRAFQARQNCLCDSEHMYECPSSQQEPQNSKATRHQPHFGLFDEENNPFLDGTKLPIAAKKGLGF